MSEWRSDGDAHVITITYSGDANYTFDVDYSDLAKNAAEDYAADHFTIDTVAPRVTGVSYSTSILETAALFCVITVQSTQRTHWKH